MAQMISRSGNFTLSHPDVYLHHSCPLILPFLHFARAIVYMYQITFTVFYKYIQLEWLLMKITETYFLTSPLPEKLLVLKDLVSIV